jgi:radical SAM protein with 4Fe4S-binding SPASM domain
MDDITAMQVSSFIVKQANGTRVNITWYGGEPLIASDKITLICSELSKQSIEFSSTIISNMSLLNSILLDAVMTVWNLKYIMVTLDALSEKYDAIKNYTNTKYNFETVINNIQSAVEAGINVDIRVNFDCHDLSNAIDVITYVKEKFGGKVTLHVKPLITTHSSAFDEFDGVHPYSKILDRQIQAGYPVTKNRLGLIESRTACPHINTTRFAVIDPHGGIYNCEKFMVLGQKIGTVWDCNEPFKNSCSVTFDYVECANCKLNKFCKGGCSNSEVLRDKRLCPQTKPILTKLINLFPEVFK